MKPAHAASTSIAGQLSLSRSWTKHAVEGKAISGVKVASTTRSMSFLLTPAEVDATLAGFVAQIAGRLVRQDVAPLENSCAFDDPIGVEAEPLVEMIVGDDGVGNIAAGGQDANARQ